MGKQKTLTKKIHVDLPIDVHQRLRIKAAIESISMQMLVARIVTKAVNNIVLPRITDRKNKNAF